MNESGGTTSPWSRAINVLAEDADKQLSDCSRDAAILRKAGFGRWTPEAKAFLTQALLDLEENEEKNP